MSSHSDPLPTSSDSMVKKPKYILITNAESYVGYTLALYIADQLDKCKGKLKNKHWRVRVLCENKQNLIHLEERGIDVCQVDYESHRMVRHCMREKIKTMILTPFSKRQNIFSQGKNLLDCAVSENVKRILMVSSLGCQNVGEEDKQCAMRQFYEIEEHLRQVHKYGYWIVFRLPFIQQYMHFWSHMIESKSVIGMPLHEMSMIYTVNMNDVCECLAQASLSKKAKVWDSCVPSHDSLFSAYGNSDSGNNSETIEPTNKVFKRVYELICTQPMNVSMIAESLTKALRETGFTVEIDPAMIEDDQLESYLKCIAEKDPKELVPLLDTTAPCVKPHDVGSLQQGIRSTFTSASSTFESLFSSTDTSKKSHDQPSDPKYLLPCPADVLTPFGIQLILDHFRRARLSQEPILPNNDIRDVCGHEPIEFSDFFMRNRHQFRSEILQSPLVKKYVFLLKNTVL